MNEKHGWKTSHIIDVAIQLCMFDTLAVLDSDTKHRLKKLLNSNRQDVKK